MRISTTKNGLPLQKHKIHPLNNNPLLSPKKPHFTPLNIDKRSPHLSPNTAQFSRHDEGFLMKNGLNRQVLARSPQRVGNKELELRQQGYGSRQGLNNLNIMSPKTNQLQQNHNNHIHFLNQYQTIPTYNHHPHQIIPNQINHNHENHFNHPSPKAIFTNYGQPPNLYTNRQIISQVQSRYESQRNSHSRNHLPTNASLEKSSGLSNKIQGSIRKNLDPAHKIHQSTGKNTLSKSKVFSNSKRPSSKLSKLPIRSGHSSDQNLHFASKNQLYTLESSNGQNRQLINKMQPQNNMKGSRIKLFKKSKQPNCNNQQYNDKFTPDTQYFGNDINTVVSSGLSPRGMSPRMENKRKTNFLRLSKSLQDTSLKSKINLQSNKCLNKVSFDKMYDKEDFENKPHFREEIAYYQNQKLSIANSQKQSKRLTEMESQLRQKKNHIAPQPFTHNNLNTLKVKNTLNVEISNRNEHQDEKTRLKIPSFQNSANANHFDTGNLHINQGFLKIPQHLTANDEYMIETRNINLNHAQDHVVTPNNFQQKPFQNSAIRTSQFIVKPSVVTDSVKSKIVFNGKIPQIKSALKVVNFSPKYDSPLVHVSKSLERPVTFNEPVHNSFQKNIIIKQGQNPHVIVRPNSSMSHFGPSINQTHFRMDYNGDKMMTKKQEFIDRVSSLSPQEQPRRPYSQSVRPLSKVQSSNLVQNSSGNSKLVANSSQNMNSQILQVNSTSKVQSIDHHSQNLNGYNQLHDMPVSQSEGQNIHRVENRNISKGNDFYHLKGKNSNVIPSVMPSHGLSSIIMGVKSYKQNDSYFNEARVQSTQRLAYNEGRRQTRSPFMRGNGSKPSSASSKGQSGMVDNTLPIDSKPNSPQHYIFENRSSAMDNNVQNNLKQQKSIGLQMLNVNSNYSQMDNGRMRNEAESSKLTMHKNAKESLVRVDLGKIAHKINQFEQGSYSSQVHKIDKRQTTLKHQYNSANSHYTQIGYSEQTVHNQMIKNKGNSQHISISHNNRQIPHMQHNGQQWLNINREKYSTSQYLKIDKIPCKVQSAQSQELNNNSSTANNVYAVSNSAYQSYNHNNNKQLESIRQSEKQYMKETYQKTMDMNQNVIPYEQLSSEDHFYHPRQLIDQPTLNLQHQISPTNNHGLVINNRGLVIDNQRSVIDSQRLLIDDQRSPKSEQLHVNNSLTHLHTIRQFNTHLTHSQEQNEMARINKIQKEQHQLRNKINSISQALLSMTPIHPPSHNPPHTTSNLSPALHTTSNQYYTQNSQQNQVDRTKQYSSIQPMHKYPNSYLSDVQYQYSEDQSYNHDNISNHLHSKASSRLSANKDLSDTRKITHAYKSTTKKSYNKMKLNKSKLNPSIINPHNTNSQNINSSDQSHPVKKVSNFPTTNRNNLQQNESSYDNKRTNKIQSYQSKNYESANPIDNDIPMRNHPKMSNSLKRQIDSSGKLLYTPIQSSQIIQLSSLNSLSFNFVTTNYQPSKNSTKQPSLLTLSKAHLQSQKHIEPNDKLNKSNKIYKQIITEPIEEQSLYRPIPYVKHKNQTDEFLERSGQQNMQNTDENNETGRNKLRLSPFSHKLRESQYGIGQDSVNYIPIQRIHKNEDFSMRKNQAERHKDIGQNAGLRDSISEVKYYESRYEYPSEELMNKKLGQDQRGYFKFDSQYLNSVEGEGSFSNVIETMNLNQYQDYTDQGVE